jgi:predicted lipoprotein with Yx(FWY)xxD motif
MKVVLAVVFAAALLAAQATAAPVAPVTKIRATGFGRVLARRDRQALYYWQAEKRAGGKIRCVGACAKAWPPLLVRSSAAVPRRVPGIRGVFGVIRRPNGLLQLTHNGLAVYTYAHEGPGQVLCDNVDGWFVVRLGA